MCGRLIPQEWASFELYTSQEHAIRPTGGASHLSFSWWWSRGRFNARLKGNSDAKNLLHRGMCSPYVSDLSFMDYWVKYTVILKLQQVRQSDYMMMCHSHGFCWHGWVWLNCWHVVPHLRQSDYTMMCHSHGFCWHGWVWL
jgi:hypothetical protein